MKYNIRKYILAGITAILAAAVLTACGGSKPEKDDTVQSTQEIFAMDTYMSLTAYGSNSEEAVSKAVGRYRTRYTGTEGTQCCSG